MKFAPKCLCLDIETSADESLALRKLGAWRADTDQQLVCQSIHGSPNLVADLDAIASGAAFVLGHNLIRHDLPVLKAQFPQLQLHTLPVVDTLELSPIAFPQNPYHSLIKDYKLIRDTRANPVKDAQLALRLWQDQFNAFTALQESEPKELACYHYLLTREPQNGLNSFFVTLRRTPQPPTAAQVQEYAARLTAGKVCSTQAPGVLQRMIANPETCKPLAYLIAWLRVSGGNSVLPTWVRIQYPIVRELIRQLRESPCRNPACAYCRTYLEPRRELERLFGFRDFRLEPRNAAGGSLQSDIVDAAYAGKSLLAILPTGGGKSICYQLPALSRHWRSGNLTIIVSPLQSLMKDQVDNLVKQGIFAGATLNGLLTLPERRDVLERIRLGDIGLLLVSPEQFRNKTFTESIRYREIGAWIFDEAHCLSKWGNDFRPDYLYVSRFIREHYRDDMAPVCCFTATAKREVVTDLTKHFKESLGIDLELFDGGHERINLHYEVLAVGKSEKFALVHRLLERELKAASGGAIVFAASRKRCEALSAFLQENGWPCAYFHAGLDAGRKVEVQKAFIEGDLRVIVATNAFGMGVDKSDVRIVIHAEIPGSLENYLQEAGRAGRDSQSAHCVLLYDEEDVETQFSLSAQSRLSRHDIAGILRSLRRYSTRVNSAEIVMTPGEILADDEIEISIEPENPNADTKVKTAVAWLERSRFLQRNENHTGVFPGSLAVGSLDEALARLAPANLSESMRAKYETLISLLINSPEDRGISTDELMVQTGLGSIECVRILSQLESLGILSADLGLTVLIRKGVQDATLDRMARLFKLEATLVELLPELAPDAGGNDWQDMNLRAVCQEIKTRSGCEFIPDQLLVLMRSLAKPFGEGSRTRRAMFDVRVLRREVLRVRLLRSWSNIREVTERRRLAAAVLVKALVARLDARIQGVDLRVECKMRDLAQALRSDPAIGPTLKDEATAIEAGLLYLHDNKVLLLDRGKSVFRSAMTIQINPDAKGRRFSSDDYEPLKEHYDEKTFQVHVIQVYARLGLNKVPDALRFVLAYFTLPKLEFIRRYFASRRDILERATTAESYRRIVEDLKNPVQQEIVTAKPEFNRLVLAGPGSGKTRVIVHRIAYLLRVLRQSAQGMVVLTFNRSAAWEIRQRLHALVGGDASGVTVLTYHALALRLTGTSLGQLAEHGSEINFDRILNEALDLLSGKSALVENADEVDELRDRLLAGYRYILVDEYQDIDETQYALISALAGRTVRDQDAKLTILAVGDDDQNIYGFRRTSNKFIRQFVEDYQANIDYLVENYRSTGYIIEAAVQVIDTCSERMKAAHPIRIDYVRKDDPAGGRWSKIDALSQGRVHILDVPGDAVAQAQVVMAEVSRTKSLDNSAAWSDFAILARNRATLDPIRAWCELEDIPYVVTDRGSGQPRLHQTREGHALLSLIRAKPLRKISQRALSRWFGLRFRGIDPDNAWQALLAGFIEEIQTTWPDQRIPASILGDLLYEFGNEARRSQRDHLVLSTVHGAKGREFRHVAILDGGDWRTDSDEERRLYYVGMTRAREKLIICQGTANPNPFSVSLDGPSVCRSPLPKGVFARPELSYRYVFLGLADVDLGFAGRQPGGASIHRTLDRLEYGDPLTFVADVSDRELRDRDGNIVGRLASKFALPSGTIVRVQVECLIWRTRAQTPEQYRDATKVDGWWVVLPLFVLTSQFG